MDLKNIDEVRKGLAFSLQDPIRGLVITDRIQSEDAIMSYILLNIKDKEVSDEEFRDVLLFLLANEGYGGYKDKLDKIFF